MVLKLVVATLLEIAVGAGIFLLVLKRPLPATSRLFDLVHLKGDDEKSGGGTRSAILSALVFIGILSAVLAVLAIFSQVRDMYRYFVGFLAIILAWRAFVGWGFPSLLGRVISNRRIVNGVIGLGAVALGTSWFWYPSWVTYDLVAVILGYVLLASLALPRLRFVVMIIVLLIGFDIVGVFVTGAIVKVAVGGPIIPGTVLMFPQLPLTTPIKYSILGMGDIFFSGVVMRYGAKYSVAAFTFAGFCIGDLLAGLMSVSLNRPVPALTTLVPCLLVSLVIGVVVKKKSVDW